MHIISYVICMKVYDKVTKDPYKSAADDEKKALTGVTNEYFPDLKKWILSHVENNQVWICTTKNIILFLLLYKDVYIECTSAQ